MTRALFLLLGLCACTQFPAVDAVTDVNAVTPALLATEDLPAASVSATSASDPLAARAAALRARAAALRNR